MTGKATVAPLPGFRPTRPTSGWPFLCRPRPRPRPPLARLGRVFWAGWPWRQPVGSAGLLPQYRQPEPSRPVPSLAAHENPTPESVHLSLDPQHVVVDNEARRKDVGRLGRGAAMDLDPVIVQNAVGGAAGTMMVQLASKSVQWLTELVRSHNPRVQEQAEANLQTFVQRLARRVEMLEAELPTDQRQVFEDALDHPSSSLLIQKAMVSAAATENDDRHTILSELIAQRLTAGADDMVALAGGAACDVVNALSSKHIRLLGLIARLYGIRPVNPPQITDQGEYDRYVTGWWKPLGNLCDGLEGVTGIDIRHLVGLSCISTSIGVTDLTILLTLPSGSTAMKPTMASLEACSWWSAFRKTWDAGLANVSPTSVGSLIGTLYHDSQLRTRTQILW